MGLGEYLKCGVPGINFPLMCLFDHLGHRAMAISLVAHAATWCDEMWCQLSGVLCAACGNVTSDVMRYDVMCSGVEWSGCGVV